jgi:hypothetical protein
MTLSMLHSSALIRLLQLQGPRVVVFEKFDQIPANDLIQQDAPT